MSEYRWKWGTPFKIGIWLYGGMDPDRQSDPSISIVRSNLSFKPGWYCFLMDVPEVLPPKKTVTEVLWVKIPDSRCELDGPEVSTSVRWFKLGKVLPGNESNWEPTNITRSYAR